MKTFDLSVFQETMFYGDLHHFGGTLFVEVGQIETRLCDIDTLIKLRKEEGVSKNNPHLDQVIKTKIKYTQQLMELFEKKIKDAQTVKFPCFFFKPYSAVWHLKPQAEFEHAFSVLLEYLYQAKNFLADVKGLIAECNITEKVLTSKNQHLLAISQSLLPSAQSIASLMTPALLAKIEEHLSLNNQLNNQLLKEEIDAIVNQSAKSLSEYLYKAENGVTANMLKGMREHYIYQLSQYEDLYHDHIETQSLLQKTQTENQALLKTLEETTSDANYRIDGFKQILNEKDEEIQRRDVLIEGMRIALASQEEFLNAQTKELMLLKQQSLQTSQKNESDKLKNQSKEKDKTANATFFSNLRSQNDSNSDDDEQKQKAPWFGFLTKPR